MNLTFVPLLVALVLLSGMLLLLEAGRRLGARRLARDPDVAHAGFGAIEGAIFALMGLLIAFTFSGAAERFDKRRAHIIEEANTIGTAWLRIDLLPESAQPALREKFRRYVDARQAVFRRISDDAAPGEELARVASLQNEIWALAIKACRDAPLQTTLLVMPALNQMIDMAATRSNTARMHPPMIIYVLLGAIALTGSLLAGYSMAVSRTRTWFHMLSFVGILALTVYVILDLEFPRIGLIRIDAFDQVFIDLRQSMGS